MANPKEIQEMEFDSKVIEKRLVDPGHLEPDDFIINDVFLRIPPQEIVVQKESFNHEWQTLRTSSSRKAKSGYGLVRVGISTIFKVNPVSNLQDIDALSRLVAGLKATPFCVVYSNYLDKMLGRPNDDKAIVSSGKHNYSPFQPIMLALASMSFSTLGHEGMPDCIRANFDFIWFNYLPFTSHVAFKTGSAYDRPGFPWHSALWKAFYAPFYEKQIGVQFPHKDDSKNRITEFMWREFLMIPKGTPEAAEASVELVNAIKNKPSEIMGIFSNIIQQGTYINSVERSDLRNPNLITSGLLDTLYLRAVKQGIIKPGDKISQNIEQIANGSITQIAGGLLSDTMIDLYKTSNISSSNMSDKIKYSLNSAAIIFNDQAKNFANIQKRGDIIFQGADGTGNKYVKLTEVNANSGVGEKFSTGGFSLFGRKRRLKILHDSQSNLDNPDSSAIIQQIIVTFRNVLATIPMLAYRYPTVQHVGSIDAEVNLVINAKNSAAQAIRDMYDRVETIALNFKQVPAGFTNLYIRNDFLNMFGLDEFLTTRLDINTIQDQPSRSLLNLTLEDAGLTSKDKESENLTQEFVQSDFNVFKEIWRQLSSNMTINAGSYDEEVATPSNNMIIKYGGDINIKRRKVKRDCKAIDADYYKMKITGTKLTGNNEAYAKLVDEATAIYNELIDDVHKGIFDEDEIDGVQNWVAFMSLKENNPDFGYIPGLGLIQKSIHARNTARKKEGLKVRQSKANDYDGTSAAERAKALARANSRAQKYTGNTNFNDETVKREINSQQMRLINMGLNRYLTKMRKLLDEIQNKYKTLDQFKKIQDFIRQLGLNKGLMAYPDLEPQMASVAKLVEGISNNSILMKYEPDSYFYYPIFNGGNDSPLLSIIDPQYINAAKIHSQKIWQKATRSIEEFFQGTYKQRIFTEKNPGPLEILNKNSPTLAKSLYSAEKYINNTQSEQIQVTVVPDVRAKISANWYPEINPSIKSSQLLSHSTDMFELWDGVTPGNTQGPQQNNVPNESSEFDRGMNSNSGPDKPSFDLNWPIRPSSFNLPKGYLFGAQRKYRNGIHGGIDVPYLKGNHTGGKDDRIINQPVFAAADGIVTVIKNLGNIGGWMLEIKHKDGWKTQYMHLLPGANNFPVTVRQQVKAGQMIARIGRSGNKTSPTHLHFQIRNPSGRLIDPLTILPNTQAVLANTQRTKPSAEIQARMDAIKQQSISRDVTTTLSSTLNQSINSFESDLYNGQAQSMMRAYPTFKLYFIEDDSEERDRLSFDDFFSYNAVQSIRVVRSRKIAADLCEIYLTNISGLLSNRRFREVKGKELHDITSNASPMSNNDPSNPNTIERAGMYSGTNKENPIASLLLQEGMHIHLRMGFSSDPDRLETVFNGIITEIEFSESDDLVCIIAQSYAVELIQDIKGIEKPINETSRRWFGWTLWGFGSGATTGRILEEMLAQPEVIHFGRWTPNSEINNSARELLTERWTFNPQPQDDNIFAPSRDQDVGLLGDGTFFKKLKYIIYRTTIWDIFQEMTLRHPNFVTLPVPYKGRSGERMTMFFGLPNQLYFARDPSIDEEIADEKMKSISDELQSDFINKGDLKEKRAILKTAIIQSRVKDIKDAAAYVANNYSYGWDTIQKTTRVAFAKIAQSQAKNLTTAALNAEVDKFISGKEDIANSHYAPFLQNAISNFYREKRLNAAKVAGNIKPFRNYHLITSSQHLVQNNIKANSRDVANTIVIKYGGEIDIDDDATGQDLNIAISGDEEEFTLKLDNALPVEETRTQIGQFINVTNKELAKRYALGLLCRNLKEIYKGEIVIIGNPKIRPVDICFLIDEYSDMVGAFEVEEVQHIFDQTYGFRTEIKPNMLVQAQEFSLLSSAEALGVVMEGALRATRTDQLPTSLSPASYLLGHGINFFGGFMAQKIINYTQLAQPVIMSPMMYRGKMFTGGVPTRKLPASFWGTTFGDWNPLGDIGYEEWKEDLSEDIRGWLSKITFGDTVGDFFNNGGDSPE